MQLLDGTKNEAECCERIGLWRVGAGGGQSALSSPGSAILGRTLTCLDCKVLNK